MTSGVAFDYVKNKVGRRGRPVLIRIGKRNGIPSDRKVATDPVGATMPRTETNGRCADITERIIRNATIRKIIV